MFMVALRNTLELPPRSLTSFGRPNKTFAGGRLGERLVDM